MEHVCKSMEGHSLIGTDFKSFDLLYFPTVPTLKMNILKVQPAINTVKSNTKKNVSLMKTLHVKHKIVYLHIFLVLSTFECK